LEPSTTKVFSKILCPVDFEHSLDALDFSITLAKQNDATLYVLNVAAIPMGAAELSSSADPEPFWEVTARTRLELLAEEKLVSVTNHELMIRSGSVAEQVVRESTCPVLTIRPA
jgi:nucleotide-binding universal stress UspA family protein